MNVEAPARSDRGAAWLLVILPVAAVLLWAGWSLLWFMCDDAFIAFRYISNRQLGWGYTWNPPPFLPVEGYTSFLWVALLDAIWTLTGRQPPDTANLVGLYAAFGSVLAITTMVWRSPWSPTFAPWRPAWVAIALIGTLTNRAFVTWTSSGLEAPLFVMLLLWWITVAAYLPRGRWWTAGLVGVGSLLTLCRPDGLLYLAFTPLVVLAARGGRIGRADLLGALPVLSVLVHLVWRRVTYGFWLPNTWYAKDSGWWPTAGLDYLGLFIIEYAWWTLVPFVLVALWRPWAPWSQALARRIVWTAVVAHVAYYVLRVGGDHFEFRVFAHLPPLLWLLLLRCLDLGDWMPRRSVVLAHMVLPCTWVIAWYDWAAMLHVTGYEEIKQLRVPIAGDLPEPLSSYARLHDRLQFTLVAHSVGSPWQTHRWFAWHKLQGFGSRQAFLERYPPSLWDAEATGPEAYPITTLSSVGVASWTMPTFAVMDKLGLNDLVIARTPIPPTRFKRMAHSRKPPPGYLDCYHPNIDAVGKLEVEPRKVPVTLDLIADCEAEWSERARTGRLLPEASPAEPEPEPEP